MDSAAEIDSSGGLGSPITARLESHGTAIRLPSQRSARSLHGLLLHRDREGEAGADFGDRLAVDPGLAHAEIERQIVAHLPDRACENGERFRYVEFPLVDNLGDRP